MISIVDIGFETRFGAKGWYWRNRNYKLRFRLDAARIKGFILYKKRKLFWSHLRKATDRYSNHVRLKNHILSDERKKTSYLLITGIPISDHSIRVQFFFGFTVFICIKSTKKAKAIEK